MGVDYDKLIKTMQIFVDSYFAPVWHTPCKIIAGTKAIKGTWGMVFIDNADVSGALGYHDFQFGAPVSKIFVKTTLHYGESVAVTATHELAEMLVDPSVNLMASGPNGLKYALETADAVEEAPFININGIPCTNFMFPSWFRMTNPPGTRYDYLRQCSKPFQLMKGGYAAVQTRNGRWTQIFGSKAKEKRFAKEDRRGHRVEARIAKG